MIERLRPASALLACFTANVAMNNPLDLVYYGLNQKPSAHSNLSHVGGLIAFVCTGATAGRLLQPPYTEFTLDFHKNLRLGASSGEVEYVKLNSNNINSFFNRLNIPSLALAPTGQSKPGGSWGPESEKDEFYQALRN